MECEVIIIFVRADLISRHCHVIWAIVSSTLCHLVMLRTIAMWGVDSWTGGQLGPSQSANDENWTVFTSPSPEWFRKADP